MTDQTTPLRDRIAATLYAHSHPGWAISFPDLDQEQRDTYLARAEAVLAVLPAPADQAAILREAADEIAGIDFHPNARARSLDIAAGLARRLRRMADETATTETEPVADLTSGTRQCGHDDYHDPHEWADQPQIWCPGYSTEPAAGARQDEAHR
ncbi:hypothetical protein ACIQ6R_16205 [Streptomyces sp. NPDC096048]|uniref:hypothetical protein n=1 Tax=Streptomyces sp. NPDC096048 TaxID=3366072 RepID=UPI00380A6BEB